MGHRGRMPHNNIMSSSDTLKMTGIWKDTIGYDPYAADGEGQDPGQSASSIERAKGFMALAKLSNKANDTRGSCKKCGAMGHLTFQCMNFLDQSANQKKLAAESSSDDDSSSSSESESESDRGRRRCRRDRSVSPRRASKRRSRSPKGRSRSPKTRSRSPKTRSRSPKTRSRSRSPRGKRSKESKKSPKKSSKKSSKHKRRKEKSSKKSSRSHRD
ncbi:hypothetical protein SDRG_10434 [Saprolegnia diclina VS20]|uniref:CCHC-type domain-containing protein n=1 Tax=Saprolegnia diclina (strain VS20) TaxID=1156394 RepID=T0RP91_SAPDV|nr:hypothetical protein SDRG_10434 [Saprolegnia diclina VS20]EQC31917.1 hypothetical protein SDRG_10434 [Saprolegnia diclina VS20]|eukprot:XP_008614645.1 hypothetical protein SDRG_10434 [Saprolegnia diclina VS20]